MDLEGIDVACAKDGEEALEWLRHCGRLPDFIFVDLRMPTMDGKTFLAQKAREAPQIAAIPVLVMTASKEEVDGPSVRCVLRKPFGIEELLPYLRWVARSDSSLGGGSMHA